MKVFVIGSGGREHALCWALAKSPKVDKVYCAPGNPGIAEVAECVDISTENIPALVRFAKENEIDLTVPGPEAVLAEGIVDEFIKLGLKIFGPTKLAAEIESSKSFAKNLMRKHGIPTADYGVFDNLDHAIRYIEEMDRPMVVKADGLAAGKGVMVCSTNEEAIEAVQACMADEAFGSAGARVVIEERMVGEEVSVLALTDGKTIAPLASAQDHKAVSDGDQGPNTGGMGAYSPAPVLTQELLDQVIEDILVPTVHALNHEGRRYKGVLYAGLMITKTGPKVVEFNCRFGDPEIQPISMRLDTDMLDLIMAVVENKLDKIDIQWKDCASVCVVEASGGYPGSYERGKVITGLDKAAKMEGVEVFHAGTSQRGERILTAGGRVLGITAIGKDIETAIKNAYKAVEVVTFEGEHHRSDIGAKALARLGKK